MKTITLNVCQGVGDIFWVYQKFAPHVDAINFNISHVGTDVNMLKIQNRSTEFLKLLPKVKEIKSIVLSSPDYEKLAHGRYPMTEIMTRFNNGDLGPFNYGCNGPLDSGVRIEDIDPDYRIEESVPIRTEYCPLAFNPGEYVCLYISGSTQYPEVVKMCSLWTVPVWLEFVMGFYRKYNLNNAPIIMIGASYDQKILLEMETVLKRSGFRTTVYIDSWSANIIYILKHCIYFLGYQSGLGVLADNIDAKQLMMYFPFLEPLSYSWCKKKNRDDGTFNAATFNKTPLQVLEGLKFKMPRPRVVSPVRKIL